MANERPPRTTPVQPASEATAAHTPPTTPQHTHVTPPFLPGNGPIHLAPSFTHQPEILYLHNLLDILFLLVTRLLEHLMTSGPVPSTTMFLDHKPYSVYYQYYCSVVDLGRASMHLQRARRLLQFVPGPPGQPGQFRVDPTVTFPSNTTDFLAATPPTTPRSPTPPHSRSSAPFSTITTIPRDKSRSQDRSRS